MKIQSVWVAVLLMLGSAASLHSQDVRYTTSALRLRGEASAESRVIANVPRGARVTVRACAVSWCWVDYGKKTGYVAERYLAESVVFEKGSGDGYTNSRGNWVPSPRRSASVPPGASARCRDGTYSFSRSRRGTCSHHGGVGVWL